jgi:purine-nucleoside phosphorylase
MLEAINHTTSFFNKKIKERPTLGIILGTGLGNFVHNISEPFKIPYTEIPNFPRTTVKGHEGQMIFGKIHDKRVITMQGRFHYYEGYSMQEVIFPVRVMKFLGVDTLIITNASGGMDPAFNVGDVMIIKDHIHLMPNPLIGIHEPVFGERFPDMSDPYDKALIEKAKRTITDENIPSREGTYVGVTGPTLETPAEYEYFRRIGGDAVGMSTTPEVIAARQMKVRCFGLSVITDLGVAGKIEKVTHEDVQNAANKAEPVLTGIITKLIKEID